MLKGIVQKTIFAEFEKSELQQSSWNDTFRDGSSILRNTNNNRFFVALSNAVNEETRKENQNFERNKIILETVQQRLATLDAGQIWQVLKVYNKRGMWDAINHIRGHL